LAAVRGEVAKAVVGQDAAVTGLLIGLLVGGHVLLEGVPGVAKTLLVRSLAAALDLEAKRVQFTPDLMPGDVTGSLIYDSRTARFEFRPGPVFTNLLLADEINRTPPKTQASLLEAMEERQVSVEGQPRALPRPFMVIATQNPVEYEGTYPLPEAQLDRFLFKISIGYPSSQEEMEIVRRHGGARGMPNLDAFGLKAVASKEDIALARAAVAEIMLTDPICAYIVGIMRATRGHPSIETGGSPRAGSMLATAARARAAVKGRSFVIPDDIKYLCVPLLRHRLVMTPAAEIEGTSPDQAVHEILAQVPAPR
jgi:MoxR-like ATPase